MDLKGAPWSHPQGGRGAQGSRGGRKMLATGGRSGCCCALSSLSLCHRCVTPAIKTTFVRRNVGRGELEQTLCRGVKGFVLSYLFGSSNVYLLILGEPCQPREGNGWVDLSHGPCMLHCATADCHSCQTCARTPLESH